MSVLPTTKYTEQEILNRCFDENTNSLTTSGGGGGGFTSPMANDTYLEGYKVDGVTTENLIGVSNGDAVVVGSPTQSMLATLVSSDGGAYITSVSVDGNEIKMSQAGAVDEYIEYRMSAFSYEESLKLETASNLGNGLDSQIRILSQAAADGDVIYQTSISALSDAQNEVPYYLQRITQAIAQDGVESGAVLWRVMYEGSATDIFGIEKGRLYTYKMPNFRAESVTGGVGYFQIETGLSSGNYRSFIGAGTTVPADASGNVFASSAIFTDTDATVDTVARTYINQGTDGNARFRAIATYTAAGQLMTPNTNSQVLVYAGTSSVAGLTFVGAGTNSGWYSSAAGVVNLTLSGTERFRFQLASQRWAQGTASTPQQTTIADADSGTWFETGVAAGFTVDATEIGRFNVNGLVMNNRIQGKQGANVASANDITLGAGNLFVITGTTTVNRIAVANWQAGSEVTLILASGITIADGVATGGGFNAIQLAGGVNLVTVAVTTLKLIYDGTDWKEVSKASL